MVAGRRKYHWITLETYRKFQSQRDVLCHARVSWLVQSSPDKYAGPYQAFDETNMPMYFPFISKEELYFRQILIPCSHTCDEDISMELIERIK